jgi:hypothetical protein
MLAAGQLDKKTGCQSCTASCCMRLGFINNLRLALAGETCRSSPAFVAGVSAGALGQRQKNTGMRRA